MKKVLILAYDFPPYNSIGGQRPYSWYKYFKKNQIYPIVFTRQFDKAVDNKIRYLNAGYSNSIDIVSTEHGTIYYSSYNPNLRDRLLIKYRKNYAAKFLAKTLTLLQILFEFTFPIFDNKNSIYKSAKDFLTNETVDLIIATGEPFILFNYAKKLSVKFNIPWIADYRDGWSLNYSQPKIFRKYFQYFEMKITSSALLLTTVSMEFKKQLNSIFPKKRIEIIYNGYFEELFSNLPNHEKPEKLTIGFSGTLYDYQPIEEILIKLYQELTHQNKYFEFHFIGLKSQPNQIKRLQSNLPKELFNTISFTKKVSQKEAILLMNKCDILMLPCSPANPQLYAKVFEYIALNKKIIVYQNDYSDLFQILKNYSKAYIADNMQELKEQVINCIKDIDSLNTKLTKTDKRFTRENQASRLANIITKL